MNIKYRPNTLGKVVILTVTILVAVIVFKKRKSLKQLTTKSIDFLREKTWDIITDRRINTLYPQIRAKAKEFIVLV